MRRTAVLTVLALSLLTPGTAWAQQTPSPSPTPSPASSPVDCSQVPAQDGGCSSPSPTTSPTPIPATCSPAPGYDCSGRYTATPGPSPTANCPYVEFSVDKAVIAPGEVVTVTARRVLGEPGQYVAARLLRRFPTPEAVVRSDTGTARIVTWPLRLGESHRFLAEHPATGQNCRPLGRPNGIPFQVDVAPQVGVSAVRHASRDYSFTGRVLPARAQRVTLWRVDTATGRRILAATSTVGADGLYRLDRRFSGSGRFGFQVDVAASASNLAGRSAIRPTVIH